MTASGTFGELRMARRTLYLLFALGFFEQKKYRELYNVAWDVYYTLNSK